MSNSPGDLEDSHADISGVSRLGLLVWIVLLLFVAMPFLCNLGVTHSWSYLKLFALQTAIVVAWATFLFARPARTPRLRNASGVTLPMTLLFAWAALSAAWSAHPWTAVRPLVELTYMAAAAVVLAWLFASPDVRWRFVPLYGAAATGGCLAYVLSHGQAESHVRVYPFENPNVAAAFAIVPMAVGAAHLLAVVARRVPATAGALGAIVMGVCGAAIVTSQSASGMAAGAGTLAMIVVLSLRARARRSELEVLAVLAIVGALWPVLAPALWPHEWEAWFRHHLGVRPALWRGAVELASERPLFGFGLGTFFVQYARVHPIEYAAHRYWSNTVDKAHCLPLHIGVELGIIGLILSTWLVVRAFRCAARAAHNASVEDQVLLRGLICGAAGMLVQGLVSESIHQPECTVHLVLALALVGGISAKAQLEPSVPAPRRAWVATLLCALAAVYMLTAVKPLFGQVHLRRAEHTPRDQWARRARALEQAARMSWPWERAVRAVWPELWNALPDVHWPTLWTLGARLKLAQVYADAERNQDALREAEAIDCLAPNLADVRRMMAALHLELGRIEDATHFIISYCKKDPLDRRAYELWAAILESATAAGRPLAAQPQKAIDFLHAAERLSPPRLRAGDARTLMQPFLRAVKETAPE